jgi:hypothetical protein
MGGLPRRDLWLLPLIAGLTVFVLLAGAELVSRWLWPAQLVDACGMPDAALGYRFRAGCSSVMKAAEGPWYTNSYNECGYRSVASCRPLPPGHRRIALIGSSLSQGYLVAYADSMAARIETDLTTMCGTPVEVQNLGGRDYVGDRLLLRMDEALRLKPDAVLFVTNPYDIRTSPALDQTAAPAPAKAALRTRILWWLLETRAGFMARNFMFQSDAIYLPMYLRYADIADFLRPPFTAPWQQRLHVLDTLVGALTRRAHDAGVPFMLVFVPEQAQEELTAGRRLPPGTDPAALPAAIADMMARHNSWFADTRAALLAQPTAEMFYMVNGHMSGAGQSLAGAFIARRLVEQPGSPFADCRPASPASLRAGP